MNKNGDTVRRYSCTCCGLNFNDRTGTRYEGIHITKEEYDSIVESLSQGSTCREAAVSVSDRTVRNYAKAAGIVKRADRMVQRPIDGRFPRIDTLRSRYYGPEVCSKPLREGLDIPPDEIDRTFQRFESVLISLGFTRPESRLLSLLVAYDGLTSMDISNLTRMSSSTIVKASESLASMGQVEIYVGKSVDGRKPYRSFALKVDPDHMLDEIRSKLLDSVDFIDDLSEHL
ncbi:hypothetical protein PED39_00075 [Methanomassiliicoccales archaeon LGM-RCC1]|nr:hypothetical protein PED39_00075 [Methanomassiliicoccales archaeon LGM-RCC1]